MKNVWCIACCYVGAMIGAGFASGQEIHTFFRAYGAHSRWGLVLAGVLFFVYGAVVMTKIHRTGATSLAGYFAGVLGKTTLAILQGITGLFLFCSYCVMVSGSGAMLRQAAGLPQTAGILLMTGLCLGIFLSDARGVVGANALLTPLMTAGIAGLWLWGRAQPVFAGNSPVPALGSAMVYVSYNTITLCGVLLPLKAYIPNKKTALTAAFAGTAVLMTCAVMLWQLLGTYPEAAGYELPMVYIAGRLGGWWKAICVAVLYMAMVTTAVSAGFGFLSWLGQRRGWGRRRAIFVLCGAAVPLAYAGFSGLVSHVYRGFGYGGLVFLWLVILDGGRTLCKRA